MTMSLSPRKVQKCTGFSIVIPSWCNLAFLRLCIESIRRHSLLDNQIIVHLNDGSDGSLDYVKSLGLDYTHSPENVGVCYSVNEAASLAKKDWLLYLNDDMYCCPGWDQKLANRLDIIGHDACLLSGTMIEPMATGNHCVSVADFGRDAATFRESELLEKLPQLVRADWYGSTWPPTVISKRWWNAVGGYSSEFSPGMSSDNDLSMKMWHAGCRIFVGVGDSLVYHFISRSTKKIKKNNGRRQFFHKWGISQSVFDRYYIRRGQPVKEIVLSEPKENLAFRWNAIRSRIKFAIR